MSNRATSLENIELLAAAAAWRRGGRSVALATVVNTWGSSPRPAGSMLAVDDSGHMLGSVSGGCVEGAVVEQALAAMRDGKPRLLEFGVSNEMAWEVGLACGGRIRVLVEQLPAEAEAPAMLALIDALQEARAAKRPVALACRLHDGQRQLIDTGADAELRVAAAEPLRADRSHTLYWAGEEWFLQSFSPPLRLLVVGAVHIAQALVPMARLADYAVTVIDPRRAFATAPRFPDTELVHLWPDQALQTLAPDSRTAVVTLTHDPKLDDPALLTALPGSAFYVGALGSRRTHAGRRQRLAEAGLQPDALARLHAPVGVDIGARSAAEIAVSILAQMTQVLRQEDCA